MRALIIAALVITGISGSAAAEQDITRWTDSQGGIHTSIRRGTLAEYEYETARAREHPDWPVHGNLTGFHEARLIQRELSAMSSCAYLNDGEEPLGKDCSTYRSARLYSRLGYLAETHGDAIFQIPLW